LCITRDQAPKLMRMLQSVQGVADEIVVVDTGSKDLSPGVARLNGARTFEIEWPGSFSDALNYAMDQVQTEWTLRLDTDEWLMDESRTLLRRLLDDVDVFAYYVLRRDLSDEVNYSESWMLRMWCTDPTLRYQGYIHEHFTDRLLKKAAGRRRIVEAPVRILHDGYLGGNAQTKMLRNVELLRRELQERPGQLYYEVDLVQTRILLKEPGAVQDLQILVDKVLADYRSERPAPFVAGLIGTALSNIEPRQLGSERTQAIIDKAWTWFDSSPPMLWTIVRAEKRRGNLVGVYRALLRLEELSESDRYEREYVFDGRLLREGLWEYLSTVADSLGNHDVAERNRARLNRPRALPS
jgi:glycosyltransferase involved in cell wall biosynthesis